jgi:hypothetical protein
MRGHIVVEHRFLHHGAVYHQFVTANDGAEHEYRFEMRRVQPGSDHSESIFEKTEDLSGQLALCPGTTIDQLIDAELRAIKHVVMVEEDIHTHDP